MGPDSANEVSQQRVGFVFGHDIGHSLRERTLVVSQNLDARGFNGRESLFERSPL